MKKLMVAALVAGGLSPIGASHATDCVAVPGRGCSVVEACHVVGAGAQGDVAIRCFLTAEGAGASVVFATRGTRIVVQDATDPWVEILVCISLKLAQVPAHINSGSWITGLGMDLDDCDVYYLGERMIDFVPYED